MHITKIKTKDKKEYEGIVLDQDITLSNDQPYITLVGNKTYKINLLDIEYAITEKERSGVRQDTDGNWYAIIEDVDVLPAWLEFYNNRKLNNKI